MKKLSVRLRQGMLPIEVKALLGSPADRSDDGHVWTYLPDRPALLVPGEALRLDFADGSLDRWEFTTVVLGQDL